MNTEKTPKIELTQYKIGQIKALARNEKNPDVQKAIRQVMYILGIDPFECARTSLQKQEPKDPFLRFW